MEKFTVFSAVLMAAMACHSCLQRERAAHPIPVRFGHAGGQQGSAQTASRSSTATVKVNPLREAYYGDLHLHTNYSLDAYFFFMGAARVDPEDAYRFAKGEVVRYLGEPVQRHEALDFLAVTDHGELMGVLNTLEDPNSPLSQTDFGKELRERKPEAVEKLVDSILKRANPFPMVDTKPIMQSAWQREVSAANRHYQPGKFTTFIAYEWGASPHRANLHRNVIFKGASAPAPFTALDSQKPEELWNWLEKIRAQGYEALAIPHNSNASNGLMYDWVDSTSDQGLGGGRPATGKGVRCGLGGLPYARPRTGKIPAIGDTVDPETGNYASNLGAGELKTVWKDPEFNPSRFAAYYLRVLEIPTPRWSTLLAIQTGLPLPKNAPATIQQRGWSSPIWYSPPGQAGGEQAVKAR